MARFCWAGFVIWVQSLIR